MQAWFHRTLLVPELNIIAARKWAQCFLCRKFIFVFPPLFQRPHCEFVSTSSSDVFIQNKLPDSLFRKSPWQKRKSCIALFKDAISRSDLLPQTTPNSFCATKTESNFPHLKPQVSQGQWSGTKRTMRPHIIQQKSHEQPLTFSIPAFITGWRWAAKKGVQIYF